MGREKKGSYHHGDLRRGLLDAALEMVRTEGVQQLSLREVARRAGVSHTAPYRHFSSKEALLAAVAEEGFLELERALRTAAEKGRTPLEGLQRAGQAYVAFAMEHPGHFRVMFGPGASSQPYPELAAATESAFGVLVATLQACIDEGLVVDRPAAELAISAWSIVHGLAQLLLDGPLVQAGDPAELAAMVTARLVEGLQAAPDRQTKKRSATSGAARSRRR